MIGFKKVYMCTKEFPKNTKRKKKEVKKLEEGLFDID